MEDLIKAEEAALRLECPSIMHLNKMPTYSASEINKITKAVLYNAISKPLNQIDNVITVLTFIHKFI